MRTSPIVDQRLAQLQFRDRFQEAEHARLSAQLPRRSHRSAWQIFRPSIVGSWWLHRGFSILTRRAASPRSAPAVRGGA